MRISELASKTGVEVETIRYYEKEGLLPAASRQDNGYRIYTMAHLEQLSFIRHCRALDISLADVKRLLQFSTEPAEDCADINQLIDTQIAKVRARLQSMQALEKQLCNLRAQCVAGHQGKECGILHELVAAAHGEACACHEH
jgi:Cd(II)/Pb(II)-responsive transcriptional regulator